jgi:ABC-type glucose/galactose transport system permease subunit
MYENQNLRYIFPQMMHTFVVCISSVSSMAIGCSICVNINLVIALIDINNFVISGGILFKILVLGINEIVLVFPLKF